MLIDEGEKRREQYVIVVVHKADEISGQVVNVVVGERDWLAEQDVGVGDEEYKKREQVVDLIVVEREAIREKDVDVVV